MSRVWKNRQKPGKWLFFGVPAGGYLLFVIGIIFWGSFNTVLEASSTETFCISCHEMRVNVYAEYQEAIHYSIRTGVRATCPDCHVPKKWVPKMIRKMQATVHESDSEECRNCHELEYMDLSKQERTASRKHTLKRQTERGETCIDCHQGIAHTLPDDWEDEF